jgi:hypothetical protein
LIYLGVNWSKNYVWKSIGKKIEELIKFKDLIKLLIGFVDLIKYSIEEKSSWEA